jgi:hypothetical protein
MLELFSDDKTGALWSTGSDADPILVRPVDLLDDATPSAASVAAGAMLRLGALTGDQNLVGHAERLLALLVPLGSDHPLAVANALGAMALAGGGVIEVTVTRDRSDLLDCVRRRYEPDAVLAWGERTSSPLWHDRPDGAAYVCHHNTCLAPASSTEALSSQLDTEATMTGTPTPMEPFRAFRWTVDSDPASASTPEASTPEAPSEGRVSE